MRPGFPPYRRFRLHINYMDEPRGYIWTVKIEGVRREFHAKWVTVAVPVNTVGPRPRQPRAYLVGAARYFTRLEGGIVISNHKLRRDDRRGHEMLWHSVEQIGIGTEGVHVRPI